MAICPQFDLPKQTLGIAGTRNLSIAREPKALGTMAVGAREAVVLMSLVQSLLFSGIIFGWPSFSMLLQQDGAFLDERRHAECRKLAPPLRRKGACCGSLRR